MVVRGEPGIGKTALLDYAAGRALGFRVIWARGVESEMELAFAGLRQLSAAEFPAGWRATFRLAARQVRRRHRTQ
jgi:hypothetical protein